MATRNRDVDHGIVLSDPADLPDAVSLWDEDKLRLLARERDLQRQADLWDEIFSQVIFGSIKA